jgi:hypothetical protein
MYILENRYGLAGKEGISADVISEKNMKRGTKKGGWDLKIPAWGERWGEGMKERIP